MNFRNEMCLNTELISRRGILRYVEINILNGLKVYLKTPELHRDVTIYRIAICHRDAEIVLHISNANNGNITKLNLSSTLHDDRLVELTHCCKRQNINGSESLDEIARFFE